MTDDAGNLSIDFLAGFTIFIIAFIYVATLVPGLFLDLQSKTIDYDAVAYRTGVILAEDPGMPYNPGWETLGRYQAGDVLRFGLAVSKDEPNILSPEKVNQFFCQTAWVYPDDYRSRAIFGDYPYGFNISLKMAGNNVTQSVGDVLPDGYGYIRRVVKEKSLSNATIGSSQITAYKFNSSDNVTSDVFSIHLNFTSLLGDVTNPAYQINPYNDQIMINITNPNTSVKAPEAAVTTLASIQICRSKPLPFNPNPPITCFGSFSTPIIDNTPRSLPYNITSNVSIIIPPGFITTDMADANTQLYFNLTFNHCADLACTIPVMESGYLNSSGTWDGAFDYNYTNKLVAQPQLQDGVLEVAVWSGSATSTASSSAYTITGVSISGLDQVLSTLTASVSPLGATATYQWYNGTSSGGPFTAISGATSSTYTVPSTYLGQYIEVVATGYGGYTGSATSSAVGPITAPLTGVSISGTVAVNSVLTAAVTPSGATATYQWQWCSTSGGTYASISGATSSTYTIPSTYLSDYIKVVATGSGSYTGSVTSTAAGPVTNALTGVSISGTVAVNSVLTAAVTPSGATATYQWQWCSTSGGTYASISGATSSTYTIPSTYLSDYIKVVATGSGSYTGSVTSTAAGPVTNALTGVSISGTVAVNSVLTAAVTPSGATATYQWQWCSTSGGTYASISGATSSTYTIPSTYLSDYIKVVATGSGSYTGSATSTAAGPITTPLTGVSISGTVAVNSVLTAAVTPSGATATYQWQWCSTSGGTYASISGATSSTYTIPSTYLSDYIKVVATGSGSYTGSATSSAVGPITTPLTGVSISGTVSRGSTLTATVTPSGATATYQWQWCSTSGGTYASISGATASTWLIPTGTTYRNDYIKVVATGSGSYSGAVTSSAVGPVS